MTDASYDPDKSITRLINRKAGDHYTVYIGRKHGHQCHYGNPFIIGIDGSRDEVVSMCNSWLRGNAYTDIEPDRRIWILQNLSQLEGEVLGCWCAPLPCHGDIYIQLLKELKEKSYA